MSKQIIIGDKTCMCDKPINNSDHQIVDRNDHTVIVNCSMYGQVILHLRQQR